MVQPVNDCRIFLSAGTIKDILRQLREYDCKKRRVKERIATPRRTHFNDPGYTQLYTMLGITCLLKEKYLSLITRTYILIASFGVYLCLRRYTLVAMDPDFVLRIFFNV